MHYYASMEVERDADPAAFAVQKLVGSFITGAIEISDSLRALDCSVRYVPIIMGETRRERYPARSRLRKKQRLYDCAPQLAYEPFVSGTRLAQLVEYCRGLGEAVDHLPALGASTSQTEEFRSILEAAPQAIYDRLLSEPDR